MPLVFLAFMSIDSSVRAIQTEVESKLNTIADYQMAQIDAYITAKEDDIALLARTPSVIRALNGLGPAFDEGTDSPEYLEEDETFRPFLTYFQEQGDYYDLFLISTKGDIIFTICHGDDFGTNLKTGPYRESELAESFDLACTQFETDISDFREYLPSTEASAFLAAPVFQEGVLIGVGRELKVSGTFILDIILVFCSGKIEMIRFGPIKGTGHL